MEQIINATNIVIGKWTLERFIDSSFEGLLVALIIAILIGILSFIFSKPNLYPIKNKEVIVKITKPRVRISNENNIGLEIELPLFIQNIGKSQTQIKRIEYKTQNKIPFSGGTTKVDTSNTFLFPYQINEFQYKHILTLNKDRISGCIIFDILISIFPSKGKILRFDAEIFFNPSHTSIHHYHIKNINKISKINYLFTRKYKQLKKYLKLKKILK